MRIMHRILELNSMDHILEEFDGVHFNVVYRYEKTLSYLTERPS